MRHALQQQSQEEQSLHVSGWLQHCKQGNADLLSKLQEVMFNTVLCMICMHCK
jgi:hypothetical protein